MDKDVRNDFCYAEKTRVIIGGVSFRHAQEGGTGAAVGQEVIASLGNRTRTLPAWESVTLTIQPAMTALVRNDTSLPPHPIVSYGGSSLNPFSNNCRNQQQSSSLSCICNNIKYVYLSLFVKLLPSSTFIVFFSKARCKITVACLHVFFLAFQLELSKFQA